MKFVIFIAFFAATFAEDHYTSFKKLQEIATSVNSAADSTWKAAVPHDIWQNEGTINLKNKLLSSKYSHSPEISPDQDDQADYCENNGLPQHFDARQHWSNCSSVISHIYDQGNCGSCWAAATVSAFTDRVCIASGGKIKSLFSIQQVLSCCHKCYDYENGCDGGWSLKVWSYIKRNGLSTGGDYGSKQGCQPYLHQNCDHHLDLPIYSPCSLPRDTAPKCKLHCYNTAYGKTFKQDRIKINRHYSVAPCAAMNEIYKYGSIVARFGVYEDFFTYKSGIYQCRTGKYVGGHVVRVIGWGEEKKVPYWLVANSWNEHWGEKGLFKIIRGTNDAGFEDYFSAAIPKLKF